MIRDEHGIAFNNKKVSDGEEHRAAVLAQLLSGFAFDRRLVWKTVIQQRYAVRRERHHQHP